MRMMTERFKIQAVFDKNWPFELVPEARISRMPSRSLRDDKDGERGL